MAPNEIDAAVHKFPVDFAPHFFGIGFDNLQRLAPFGLDDLRSFVERDIEGLGLVALTNHTERVPSVRRRNAVKFVEALVLRLAIDLSAKMPLPKIAVA